MSGYVNITQHRGGKVTFTAEDAEDSAPSSAFVKSVKEIPYDLAVLQISKVLASPEAEAPVAAPAPVNITELLSKKYCKSFAGLLAADADAYSTINATKDNGLTLFCPVDSAVASFMPKYKNLTAKGRTAILLYHAVPDYYSLQLLTSISGKVSTLATSNVAKKDYSFDVEKDGETAELDTKVNSASVTYTIKDDDPLAVYAISKFLQPKELYKIAKDIAPAPAPEGPKKKKTTKKKPSAAASPSDDDDDDDSAADSPDDSSSDDATADKDGAAPSAVAGWVTAAVAVASALALAA
uniref:FAS1 domain-containing protein n=2 Tax=Aegilops tauschii TaxID=37682 RepID=A0A453L7A5_AEGTS